MKISTLKKLTKNEISIHEFITELSDELNEYKKLIEKKGASIPIYVNKDIEFEFGCDELEVLCKHFTEGNLNTEELAYLADAIELTSDIYVPEEKVREFIFEMTDPAVNGVFTKERAIQIINEIKL